MSVYRKKSGLGAAKMLQVSHEYYGHRLVIATVTVDADDDNDDKDTRIVDVSGSGPRKYQFGRRRWQ